MLLLIFQFAVAQDKKQESAQKKNISQFTEKLQKIDGFVPIYLNAEDGKIYLEITRFNSEFLYQIIILFEVSEILINSGWNVRSICFGRGRSIIMCKSLDPGTDSTWNI